MIKERIQGFLRRMGAYDRMRETLAYDIYRHWKHGYPVGWRENERRLFASLLRPLGTNPLVFDIGANRGQRTEVFLRLGARVIAVEPDPLNQRLLTRRFSRRRLGTAQVTVVGKAVSSAISVATLWIHRPGSGLNSLNQKWVESLGECADRFGTKVAFEGSRQVETTTLDALIGEFGVPGYIKVDVEGHELAVFQGLGRKVPILSFEVNLPEMFGDSLECLELLGRLSPSGRFNWFVDFSPDFSLPQWMTLSEFAPMLRGCREKTIEVFWRSEG